MEPKVTIIEGTARAGKTGRLIEEARNLLWEGVAPQDVVLFAASPVAAQDVRRRMDAAGLPRAVEATTPRAYFLRLLGEEEAQRITGRRPRLLLPFEYDIFLEDMKTSGLRPKRLREILKFFYRGFAEGDSERDDWLITNEERELMGLLNDILAFQGALLDAEVAPFAGRVLRESAPLRERAQRSAMLVDDYPLLSRATQQALGLLAADVLVATGEGAWAAGVAVGASETGPGTTEGAPAGAVAAGPAVPMVFEAYPHGAGLAELKAARPDATVVELIPAAAGAPAPTEIAGADPRDEMVQVAALVADAVAAGTKPEAIVVAAEHPAWRHNVARALSAAGVPATELPDSRFLRCDVRRPQGNVAVPVAALLALAADPSDSTAWRSWCAFGDYLANGNGMRSLRNRGRRCGRDFVAVMEAGELQPDMLDGLDALGSIRRIEVACGQARAILDEVAGLEGAALLAALAQAVAGPEATVPPALAALALGSPAGEGEEGQRAGAPEVDQSAAAMIGRVRQAVALPVFPGSGGVRIVALSQVAGLTPRLLVLAGFMNGFFPDRAFFDLEALTVEQQERQALRDRVLAETVFARASGQLVLARAEKLDVEDAERLGLAIERIAFEDGCRMARTEPSLYWPSTS